MVPYSAVTRLEDPQRSDLSSFIHFLIGGNLHLSFSKPRKVTYHFHSNTQSSFRRKDNILSYWNIKTCLLHVVSKRLIPSRQRIELSKFGLLFILDCHFKKNDHYLFFLHKELNRHLILGSRKLLIEGFYLYEGSSSRVNILHRNMVHVLSDWITQCNCIVL